MVSHPTGDSNLGAVMVRRHSNSSLLRILKIYNSEILSLFSPEDRLASKRLDLPSLRTQENQEKCQGKSERV